MRYLFSIIILTVFGFLTKAQTPTPIYYAEPEIMLGKIVPTNSFFPKTGIQNRYRLSLGKVTFGDSTGWSQFYNYPMIGITLSYNRLGNDSVFGNSYGIMPFIEFKSSRKKVQSIDFRLGIGASYFNTPFNIETNPLNKAIGSQVTWSFQAWAYKRIYSTDNFSLRIGAGYLHSSNGHTQIPNFGLNSAAVSLSAIITNSPHSYLLYKKQVHSSPNKTRAHTVGFRQGIGFHELGGTAGPIGGDIKAVYSSEFSAGIIFRQYMNFYGGFTYRYYSHYYNYLTQNNTPQNLANRQASNVYLFLGIELMMGHVSIDIQGGLNLYKPFYKTFDDLYQHSKPFDFWLKQLFPSRMGLKFYALNQQKKPTNNFFAGANISANFGEADFSEFSFGYVRFIK